jgi:hypothetical protein
MWRIILTVLLLAGCVQVPPRVGEIDSKRFEPVPGQSVIYIVRTPLDSRQTSPLWLGDHIQISTWEGWHYRWVVPPGTHRVAGFGRPNELVTLTTDAGGVYFLEHTVRGTMRSGPQITALRRVDEQYGRSIVARSLPMYSHPM